MMDLSATRALLTDAVNRGVIPCAAYAVGRGEEVYARESLGFRSLFPYKEAITDHTRFDMASLSKVMSTTMVALKFIEEGKLLLTDSLSRFFTEQELEGAPAGRRDVTVFHLMTHSSGISPHLALWRLIRPCLRCGGAGSLLLHGVHSPAKDFGAGRRQGSGRACEGSGLCALGYGFYGVSSLW